MVFAENILRIFRENKLLAKYRLKDVFVFGSSVRTATPNDIDLLVRDFQDYNDLLSLRKELSEKTGKSVDVVIEKFANPIILYRASKESIRVEWPQKRPFPLVGNARIGESINKLSETAKAGIASENIQAIRGMRNRIVHDYAGLDSFVVYETIKNDLDPLKETFVKIIREGLANKSFDEGEFEAAKNSGFYKFIDFDLF